MRLAIVTKVPIKFSEKLSGQKCYIRLLMKVLRNLGIDARLAPLNYLFANRSHYDVLHCYYLGLKDVIKLRKVYANSTFAYYVFHIDDATWSRLHSCEWKLSLSAMQLFINKYIATARSVYARLKNKIILSDIMLVEPYYECSCKAFGNIIKIVEKKFTDDKLKLLYIGRLHPLRFTIRDAVTILRELSNVLGSKTLIEFTIVTKTGIETDYAEYRLGNAIMRIINREISEKEKCRLYTDSHFFIYPARRNVAMNPPITLLESVYHGVLPIVSPQVLSDVNVPSELVANCVSMIVDKIINLWSDPKHIKRIINELWKSFARFYDISRFIRAVKYTL